MLFCKPATQQMLRCLKFGIIVEFLFKGPKDFREIQSCFLWVKWEEKTKAIIYATKLC